MSIDQKFILGDQLTAKQLAFFNEFGFIHFRHVLNRNEIDQMIAAVQDLERSWIEEDVTKVNGIPIKYGKDETGNRIVQRFAFA
ncbi:MAG TPA: phytanoyl-CoA dioxygenase, partial [Puia sp.]|nr:phytanoyl-CoA dioxygenase [Puia sp.]